MRGIPMELSAAKAGKPFKIVMAELGLGLL